MDNGERVTPGDRLRLTTPLIKTILQAVQANEDHVVIRDLTRKTSEQDGDVAEIRLEVTRADA